MDQAMEKTNEYALDAPAAREMALSVGLEGFGRF
jgi:hypothetical protein